MFKKEFRKPKKPELSRRSVSNFDQDVFDYALEDACVKVANVKSGKEMFARCNYTLPRANKNTLRVQFLSAGGGTRASNRGECSSPRGRGKDSLPE